MVFGIFRWARERITRKIQRDFLIDSDKTSRRYAMFLASIVLISMIITYNVLFEKEKKKQGIQPPSAMDLYRELNAKKRLEHIELQRNIAEARERARIKTSNDM